MEMTATESRDGSLNERKLTLTFNLIIKLKRKTS